MSGLRIPPGRAGRLWLRRRLSAAEHAAELLDQKLRILRAERQRMLVLQDQATRQWVHASAEAGVWTTRAVLLGGTRSIRLAAPAAGTDVELRFAQVMGVRYPVQGVCTLPGAESEDAIDVSCAIAPARAWARQAVTAAVDCAVVDAALAVLEAQEAGTRRRLRAVEDRWIPRLHAASAAVQLALEEEEHADAVRLRWARTPPADINHESGSSRT